MRLLLRIFILSSFLAFLSSCSMEIFHNPDEENNETPTGGGTTDTGTAPADIAAGLYFADHDPDEDAVGGSLIISKAADESNIKSYVVYLGTDAATKSGDAVAEISVTGSDITYTIPDATSIIGKTHILVYSKNEYGESTAAFSLEVPDLVVELATSTPMEDVDDRQHGLVKWNNKLYYSANDGINGAELWSFDGTTETMISDSCPGACDSAPMWITEFNDKLFYMGGDGVNGRELWVYDGINPPSMVIDLNPGAGNSAPTHLYVYNNKLYFNAADSGFDFELWVYDGIAPPSRVADIRAGLIGSYPYGMTEFNGKLYFSAQDSPVNRELWVYDGVNPPSLVYDICVGGSADPGGVYGGSFTELGGKIYFHANDCISGIELWSYDGISDPVMVKNISADPFSSNPDYFSVLGDKLYFSANSLDAGGNSPYGSELYSYDPATDTLSVAADIVAGTGDSSPAKMEAKTAAILFTATTVAYGNEPYIYDGRTAYMIYDLNPGAGSSNVSDFAGLNGKLYFNGGATGLWAAYIK